MNRFNETNGRTLSWDHDLLAGMAERLVDPGWATITVEAGPWPWAYSVGLTERGLPELVVANLKVDFARETVDTIASGLTLGLTLDDLGEINDLTFGDIHQNHFSNGLVSAWDAFYSHTQRGRSSTPADFVQVIPGPTYFCKTHQRRKPDLSSASTPLLGLQPAQQERDTPDRRAA